MASLIKRAVLTPLAAVLTAVEPLPRPWERDDEEALEDERPPLQRAFVYVAEDSALALLTALRDLEFADGDMPKKPSQRLLGRIYRLAQCLSAFVQRADVLAFMARFEPDAEQPGVEVLMSTFFPDFEDSFLEVEGVAVDAPSLAARWPELQRLFGLLQRVFVLAERVSRGEDVAALPAVKRLVRRCVGPQTYARYEAALSAAGAGKPAPAFLADRAAIDTVQRAFEQHLAFFAKP